jgi:prevent-host-death family protein
MTTVDIAEAAAQLPQLIERARAGEDIAIARDGRPVARLQPVAPAEPSPKRRVGGQLEGEMWISPDFDAPLPDEIARAFGMLDS